MGGRNEVRQRGERKQEWEKDQSYYPTRGRERMKRKRMLVKHCERMEKEKKKLLK